MSKSSYVAIKTKFNAIFKKNLLIKELIKDVVSAVTPILVHTHLFATFHATRLLETGQDVGCLDQTFYNRCTAAVTRPTDGSQPLDHKGLADPSHPDHNTAHGRQFCDLKASLVDYNASLPDGHQKLDRPAVLKDVSIYLYHASHFRPVATMHILICNG